MGQEPEGVTTPADIEATRSELSRDIDELADKISPARVVSRRTEAAKGRIVDVRSRVMGTGQSVGHSVVGAGQSAGQSASDTASGLVGSVGGAASGAVDTVESRTQGSPLAAGVAAFGLGMVIAALVPASKVETAAARRVTETAKEHGQPLLDEAKSVGQDIGQNLKASAQESVEAVKETAKDSASTVAEEGKSSAATVQDEARSATP